MHLHKIYNKYYKINTQLHKQTLDHSTVTLTDSHINIRGEPYKSAFIVS